MSEPAAGELLIDLATEYNAGPDEWRSLEWRLDNLYFIVDKDAQVVKFRMNDEQRDFVQHIWYRNLILKARQKGFSTLLQIIQLDQAWWNPNHNGVVIADTLPNASKLFGKVEFAYARLPPLLREAYPVQKREVGSLLTIAHTDSKGLPAHSTISVSVSSRGGTVQLLHVSELGKIALKFPQRAEEIKTGALPSVPPDGVVVIESTAEGAFGLFWDLCEPAIKRWHEGAPETRLDFRLHFYPWYTSIEYRLPDEDVPLVEIPSKLTAYFQKLQAELGIVIDANQRAWYAKTFETLKGKMKQEYPACVAGSEPVFSPEGITRMDSVPVDGSVVHAFYPKGARAVFRLTTDLGYEVTCTADHPIKTPGGFIHLERLQPGGKVLIGAAVLAHGSPQSVSYAPLPFVTSTICVDETFGEFLGFFIGDGSYSRATLSVACYAGDADVVERVCQLVTAIAGAPTVRRIGGCDEVRVGCEALREPFDALGILRRNSSGQIKRCVSVPDAIKRAQFPVARAFLRGLFEADGFAQRNGTGVKFFTKYEDFGRDVQLLLLRFGITCKRSRVEKTAANGSIYVGWELSLRTAESVRFSEVIGFVSARKQDRASTRKTIAAGYERKRLPIANEATIVSIEPAGFADVFDITTATHEFSAGGIVVHNCPEEAFEQAIEGAVYGEQMTWLRENGRLGIVPLDPSYPVNTFWDFGVSDMTAIWFHQTVGLQHRWFYYFEKNGKGLRWWWNEFLEPHRHRHKYQWGKHVLPHDAEAEMLGEVVTTKRRILEELGMGSGDGGSIVVVPRVATIGQGIEITRKMLGGNHWFDKRKPDELKGEDMGAGYGIACMDGYQFTWDDKRGVWSHEPLHNWASHGADAWRQYAQAPNESLLSHQNAGLAKFKQRVRRGY